MGAGEKYVKGQSARTLRHEIPPHIRTKVEPESRHEIKAGKFSHLGEADEPSSAGGDCEVKGKGFE